LLLGQFACASVDEKKNFDNVKMHGMYVKILNIADITCARNVSQ